MTQYCDKLQQRLGIEGLTVVKGDQDVQDHLAECEACFAVFEVIGQLDPLLKSLPVHDASDELVDQTINAVKEAGFEPEVMNKTVRSWSRIPGFLLTGLIAVPRAIFTRVFRFPRQSALIASLVLILSITSIIFLDQELTPTFDFGDSPMVKLPESILDPTRSYSEKASSDVYRPADKPEMPAEEPARGKITDEEGRLYAKDQPIKRPEPRPPGKSVGQTEAGNDLRTTFNNDFKKEEKKHREPANNLSDQTEDFDQRYKREDGKVVDKLERSVEKEGKSGNDTSEVVEPSISEAESFENDDEALKAETALYDRQRRLGKGDVAESNRPAPDSVEKRIRRSGEKIGAEEFFDDTAGKGLYALNKQKKIGTKNEIKKQDHGSDARRENSERNGALKEQEKIRRQLKFSKSNQVSMGRKGARKKVGEKRDLNHLELPSTTTPAPVTQEERSRLNSKKQLINSPAERFLAARRITGDLKFKQASGYWANNYLPGDPTVRRLHTTLLGKSLQPLEQHVGKRLSLHNGARQTSQPFDLPEHSALAVYLHADQTGLPGKRRMLIQVGLQGSSRRSGSRPAMNVGVVIDLRGKLDKPTITRMRSLLFALNKARDIGDRFSLVLAGKPGGVVVKPDEFRHGPLMIAMQNVEQASSTNSGLSLTEAIEAAIGQVSSSDDPTAPLGSSVVLLVTNQQIGSRLNRLATLAHHSAVAGIPMSTIAAGTGAVVEELDKIALAGQGNRRMLDNTTDANKLIRKELSAVSEVVARAVRLRIRLAAGVRLVDVIGSFRLDEVRAERVRQAEQSIDRRLSRNLGIESDRGEDEEGIQIVIPAFYADTSHVILLDVVVPGPGAVADVTVRYKDLVQLKNGVARANLSLDHTESAAGPLERNVTKNFLAFSLSQTLTAASKLLENAHPEKGEWLIREQLALLESFRDTVPGFDRDPDILADINMLKEYSSVMQTQAYKMQPEAFIDSLALAGKMKVLPRPDINEREF